MSFEHAPFTIVIELPTFDFLRVVVVDVRNAYAEIASDSIVLHIYLTARATAGASELIAPSAGPAAFAIAPALRPRHGAIW